VRRCGVGKKETDKRAQSSGSAYSLALPFVSVFDDAQRALRFLMQVVGHLFCRVQRVK
jgi:hypothetical protein